MGWSACHRLERELALVLFDLDDFHQILNDAHWVKAVDPKSRGVFAFQAQIVPANRITVPAP